jgi:hypothetical protein
MASGHVNRAKQAEHMAAPTNAAQLEDSPCQPGANGMDPALTAEWNLERQLQSQGGVSCRSFV